MSSSEPISSVSRRISASTVYIRRRKAAWFKRAHVDGIASHFRIVVKQEVTKPRALELANYACLIKWRRLVPIIPRSWTLMNV